MNIMVLYGSKSCEHDISVITARQVVAAIGSMHRIFAVYIDRKGVWRLKKPEENLEKKAPEVTVLPCCNTLYARKRCGLKRLTEIDAAIPALHGVNGEDGTVQGLLHLAGIPFTSSGVVASAVTMDKIITKTILKGLGVPVLDYGQLIKKTDQRQEELISDEIMNGINYPVVIKPANLGSSIGIGIANNAAEFREKAAAAFEYDTRILYECALSDFTEVNIAAYEYEGKINVSRAEKPLSVHEILTFEDKYKTFSKKESKRIFPFTHPLTEEMSVCSEKIYTGINAAGIVRIDFLIDNLTQNFYVNEINSIPGSLAHYLFPEISFPELLDRLIENAVKERRSSEGLSFVYKTDILSGNGKM